MLIEANEKQSGIYGAVLRDEFGNPVSSAALDSFTITLHDKLTPSVIINGRDHQNALNANQVTIDTQGNVQWIWLPDDMPVLNPNRQAEEHIALFEAKWTDGGGRPRRAEHELPITVKRIQQRS